MSLGLSQTYIAIYACCRWHTHKKKICLAGVAPFVVTCSVSIFLSPAISCPQCSYPMIHLPNLDRLPLWLRRFFDGTRNDVDPRNLIRRRVLVSQTKGFTVIGVL
jgi:hypothetical protein